MLGGSNMEDKGNVNSMGYLIQTTNNKLIVVDGGRDIDSGHLVNEIKQMGNGKVDYWFLTHAHNDHIGAIMEILKDDACDISIENLCYHFNTKDWYEENDPTRKDIAIEFIDYIFRLKTSFTVIFSMKTSNKI
jgi:glyoxylase-like metal-dependent hydrolase (beta-lactamase superfamily II)